MKLRKAIFSFCTVIFSAVICVVSSFASSAHNWYCVRNSEHKQPNAAPELLFVERYGGFYVDKDHTDGSADKVIYLTFDAGYENGNVEKILNVLKEEEVTGAFFILSNLIKKNPELVKRMADEGHTVCNHTSTHRDMSRVLSIDEFSAETEKLEREYEALVGLQMPKYFRYPEGRFSEQSMKYASELGYKSIFWSFAYADWDNAKQPSPEAAKKKIMDNIHNGEVMLLHPTSATNAAILGDVIRELKAGGYRFGTLDELCSRPTPR